ncbi:MAG: leucyl aminopeptidase [SAR202 cluster bacterium]|nr:leucyl aminopeptidase [SAR202 cluster bacterium]
MDIRVVAGDITARPAAAIIVNLFEGVASPGGAAGAVDSALGGAIAALIADGETKGKLGEVTLLHTLGKMAPARVVVVGLGKQEKFGADAVRTAMAAACRHLRGISVERIATIVHGAGVGGLDARQAAEAVTEGALLGLYRFDKYKTSDAATRKEIKEIEIVEADAAKIGEIEAGVTHGRMLAEATVFARDMINEPGNVMTPTRMAERALEVSREASLGLDVIERPRMKELGMGAFLGVAQGSVEPPKLIVLKYTGDPENPTNNLGLLGKGITFDSGGISIKPSENMGDMKGDMAGGAAVISAMKVIGRLKPRINVYAIVPATENMPGGRAQRPGDIVKTMNGKTIEIDNTDAEGRLVLADAMAYARSLGIERIVDVATLTGAMIIGLGKVCTGVFGNNQQLIDSVLEAGKQTGERMWQLPMFDDYKDQYKSEWADIKNTGGRPAGSITGAHIIGEFAAGAAWAHLDIAGTSMADGVTGTNVKGATGVMVRSLAQLAVNLGRS